MKNNHSLLLIFAIIVTLFVASVYGYMYYRIDISAEKINDAQSMIDSKELAVQREKKFLETYKATAPKWTSLQNFFVRSNDVVSLIELLESFGPLTKTDVVISSIEADNMDGVPAGKEGKIKMHISVKGAWNSVLRVLALVESLPYKLSINNLRAGSTVNTSAKANEAKSSWDMAFDLQVAMISVATSTVKTK
jgi:hypothetical protein